MNQFELEECLTQKRQIIQSILANNETQRYYIQRQNMKGLRRLLLEREQLIEEFAAVEGRLKMAGNSWQQAAEWQAILQNINQEQAALLNSCKLVVQEAGTARQQMATKLREIKAGRLLTNHYAPSWPRMVAGRQLSIKG